MKLRELADSACGEMNNTYLLDKSELKKSSVGVIYFTFLAIVSSRATICHRECHGGGVGEGLQRKLLKYDPRRK